jgi:hypothetical protein
MSPWRKFAVAAEAEIALDIHSMTKMSAAFGPLARPAALRRLSRTFRRECHGANGRQRERSRRFRAA